jgi:hypothetical protein
MRLYYYRRMSIARLSRRAVLRMAGVVLVFASLAGCLSTETSVSLRANGSGTIDLVYRIDRQAWEIGVFDESDVARPIPVTHQEFEDAALRIDGLRLRSHRISLGDDLVTVTARLDFDDPATLQRFLGADTLDVRLEADGGYWRQTVAGGQGVAGAGALAQSLSMYSMRFALDPPRSIISTNGELARGTASATYALSLADVVTATEPVVWEVRW